MGDVDLPESFSLCGFARGLRWELLWWERGLRMSCAPVTRAVLFELRLLTV